ncbi:MAG: exo-alpha-sialidase [Phycisphaerae bacterium]|nr:exo-alpha-sialidase [Phycisphaerae bacterium]
MRLVASGIVCPGRQGTARSSCAFANIAVLPNGRWLCGFRGGPTKTQTVGQHVLLTCSDDEGRSWSPPVSPFVPPPVEGRPGLFRAAVPTALPDGRVLLTLCWVDHSDPSLPFFNEQTEGLLDTRLFHAWSTDNGETWSEPVLMDTTPYNVPTPVTGPVLVLRNGELACQFELNKHYNDTSTWRHSSVLMFSGDGGTSWPGHVVVSNDPANRFFYWDQRPGVLADGRILDVFWTYDNQAAAYLNIHARESVDHGRTWSEMWVTNVPGQPAQPVSLADGRIAMVYVDRTGRPTIKVRASDDGGHTFPAETEVVIASADVERQTTAKQIMQDAWAEMEAFSLGLPATTPLPNGDVLVVYYAGPETDVTDVRWARLRP